MYRAESSVRGNEPNKYTIFAWNFLKYIIILSFSYSLTIYSMCVYIYHYLFWQTKTVYSAILFIVKQTKK